MQILELIVICELWGDQTYIYILSQNLDWAALKVQTWTCHSNHFRSCQIKTQIGFGLISLQFIISALLKSLCSYACIFHIYHFMLQILLNVFCFFPNDKEEDNVHQICCSSYFLCPFQLCLSLSIVVFSINSIVLNWSVDLITSKM